MELASIEAGKPKRRLPVGLLLALFIKSTKLVKVVKLVKTLKFAKVFLTLGTMLISVFAYSFTRGPGFAIGFVLMLFIHELGHVLAMRQKGHPASAPVFIPFLGALIFSPTFKNAEEEAYIGYGGPLLGSVAALSAFGLWALLPGPQDLLLLVSYTAAFLNLFNLIPIRPLDGGRVTHIIGAWFKWVGVILLLGFSMALREPSILLIWILLVSDIEMDPKKKLGLQSVCWVAMSAFMIAGYGQQIWWINLIDIILGAFIAGTGYYRERKTYVPSESVRIEAPPFVRMKWFALYASLFVGLLVLMIVQAQFLQSVIK